VRAFLDDTRLLSDEGGVRACTLIVSHGQTLQELERQIMERRSMDASRSLVQPWAHGEIRVID
jgi:hypothetical protein